MKTQKETLVWHLVRMVQKETETECDGVLPEEGETVLVTLDNGDVEVDFLSCDDGFYFAKNGDTVVAWASMPKGCKGT